MAEEFQTGIFSASWWSSSRNGLEVSGPPVSTASCSAGITDIGAPFGWTPETIEAGHIEDGPRLHISDSSVSGGALIGTAPLMADFSGSSPSLDWNQALLGRVHGGFHGVPPEDLTPTPYYRSEGGRDYVSQGLMAAQTQFNSGGDSCFSESFPVVSAQVLSPSGLLPGFHQDSYTMNSRDSYQPSWARFPNQQMHFSDNIVFYPPLDSQFEDKPNASTTKSSLEVARESSTSAKKSGGEPAASFKKARMETPSSLPTFKVRKEKLGDRITALQQLVSPFGKTDTASVLHEAIDYIKFLHEQVNVLSTPYLQNVPAMQRQRNSEKQKDRDSSNQDLRSRGLCLVPISSTLAVANGPMAEFWTPTFGGTYR